MRQIDIDQMRVGDEILISSRFGNKTVKVVAIRDGWDEDQQANFFTVICRDLDGRRVFLGYNKDVPYAKNMLGEEYWRCKY